jgi:hypothetical protein
MHRRCERTVVLNGDEQADRFAPGHRVTVDDVRELEGPATPHFALQIRDRIRRLIQALPDDDPATIEGERAIARLERMAREGQTSGHVQDNELPLPSLELERPLEA